MTDIMDKIKNLRQITGAGFLDCKKALEANDNDIKKSIDFLRKKGLAKAIKKSSREANEGVIGIFTDKNLTTILQINTETDFAAKNNIFLNFVEEIGKFSLKTNNSNLNLQDFNEISFEGIAISDRFKDIIAKIGENIVLNKLIVIENANSMISHYTHNAYKENIGKIGVVLKTNVDKKNNEALLLGKNLCMHIAASKPLSLDIKSLDETLIEKEREVQLESIKSSGKPENIIDKILEGKMKKFYSESTFLNQAYILDPDKNIGSIISDFSQKNNFEILDYKILVLGD